MRDRIWNNLANIRYKAIYMHECSKLVAKLGRFYSFFLAIISTSSVAAWALWQEYPSVWAIIVAVSQILHVAKPYIPYIKYDKEYLEMHFKFENLYLKYERLWFKFESNKIKDSDIEDYFYKLREQENKIQEAHKNSPTPELIYLMDRSDKKLYSILNLNF
ncbi:MAG: hypothetical protein JKY09_03470 [Crocinitomicaceae bacterium]|nr:hypothetical protein [Crocinitomicaceae bacterium]